MTSVLSYATFMNPRIFFRFGAFSYDMVWLLGYQRFFGVVNITGRTLDSVFGSDGNLVDRNVGVTTIVPSSIHRVNAVLYHNVSDDAINDLDISEEDANMTRRIVDETLLTYFENSTRAYLISDGPVFAYPAKDEIEVNGRGSIQLIRDDVRPNLEYLRRCREAADYHGIEFRRAYDETTFLARRRTRLSETGL